MTRYRAVCSECDPQPNAPEDVDGWRGGKAHSNKAGAQADASRHNEKVAKRGDGHVSVGATVEEVADE